MSSSLYIPLRREKNSHCSPRRLVRQSKGSGTISIDPACHQFQVPDCLQGHVPNYFMPALAIMFKAIPQGTAMCMRTDGKFKATGKIRTGRALIAF